MWGQGCLGLLIAGLTAGCVEDIPIAEISIPADTPDTSVPEEDAGDAMAEDAGDAPIPPADAGFVCEPVACRGQPRACGNCLDDDEDGLPDYLDPDCWGPCDDSESLLDSRRSCPSEACIFDPNCGSGDDERCLQLIPNGCDCHGCCAVPGQTFSVMLNGTAGSDPTCSTLLLEDESACVRCEQDPSCMNECGECELCFGKKELPPTCASDAGCPQPECDGQQACGFACSAPCPPDTACVSGCCAAVGP